MENHSPVPQKQVKLNKLEMPFNDAIRCMMEGAKVTRIEWGTVEEFGYMKDGFLLIHTKGNDHKWIISDGDYTATDWVIV